MQDIDVTPPGPRALVPACDGFGEARSSWARVAHYAEEAPAHKVTVDGFWIDSRPVTNESFAQFVDATGHTTVR